jgi:hypothetical protein
LQLAYQNPLAGTQNAFVAKFKPGGQALDFSTYLGGENLDQALGIAIDPSTNIYVTGSTSSMHFPVTPGAFSTTARVNNDDWVGLVQLTRREPAKIFPYLISRLCSADTIFKWKVVQALGFITSDREAIGEHRIRELLRRFVWMLSDESGNVPFGVPEAFGEVLAVRSEFHAEFLPLLCSLAHDPERIQTGPIEQGVYWALGRLGQPVAACSPEAVEAITCAAHQHPDPQTRSIAAWALSRF